jgi:DNA-binding NarL/FixJ family response regulator
MEKRIRVLLADDTVIAREGWKAILKTDPDIEIVGEAEKIPEVISKVQSLDPDIVLMDLKWGADRMAGWSAIREMKKVNDRAKIIAMTAYVDLIADARRAGADDALLKDFTREELLHLIRELHQRQFSLRADHGPDDLVGGLTPRELEVLRCVAEGCSDREIAERLSITESTAKNHMRSVLDKLEAKNRTHAVAVARERGILK